MKISRPTQREAANDEEMPSVQYQVVMKLTDSLLDLIDATGTEFHDRTLQLLKRYNPDLQHIATISLKQMGTVQRERLTVTITSRLEANAALRNGLKWADKVYGCFVYDETKRQ